MKTFLCVFLCIAAAFHTLNILSKVEKKNATATAVMYAVSVAGIVILQILA